MKLLCICDAGVNRATVTELEGLPELGFEVSYYDNQLMDTIDKTMECMHETELNGPEGYPFPEELLELVKDVDVIVVHVTPITKRLIDAAVNLKMVAVMRGGCDNVDVDYLIEKGITVSNAAWRSANAVADATLGMMLAEMKNIARSHAALKKGIWMKDFPNNGNVHDLKTRTVGIIGFGNIGQRVAQRLKGFEPEIIVHDPYMADEVIEKLGYRPVSKEQLLREADVITIHLRQSERTEGFIGKEEIAMMKPTATIVNTARARLIDEEALAQALADKRLQGASLDVFYEEPLPADHPFMTLENVTLASHIAGTSADTIYNSVVIVMEDLKRFLKGEKVQCPVIPLKG